MCPQLDTWPCSDMWVGWESESVRKYGCSMKEELENNEITLGKTTRDTGKVMAVG